MMMGEAGLSSITRQWLIGWARQSIRAHLQGEQWSEPVQIPEEARRNAGCFVTLHAMGGGLRGCIGTFLESEPLWVCVNEMAISAATRDPRFPEVKLEELRDCTVEISVLTPRVPARPEEIEVGKHGLWVTRGAQRGVLLPQVATEYAWDRDEFLSHTCVKAGLPADAWSDGSVNVEVFTAQVFSEGVA